ncbi:DUF1120 domain-containing protein [Pseudomonas sp. 14P_8.1_Bac3]|uniref:DUF1120 domain-containing protein n=1 Tax=Pseudomonas sp. 14P_8.1_Bac3 TaxID=2971621 RepID=UPI0021CA984C|nr:DUF1120 domain-containing protein [Pseudomonas sp. 14P_8.1_Bac3]MCU1760554.1 DUF1120 domain-containing protein [Pseudomonas sp. 14P_8.1_Bac3]
MGKKLSYLTAVVCLAAASNVSAASSTDLSVKGTITPAACVPQLSNGGVVDHGKISIKDLPGSIGAIKPLPNVTLQLSVSCDAATFFAVKSTDNRKNTAADNSISSFGLGLGENDQKLGLYTLRMENALADGAQASLVESVDGTTWFLAAPGQIWQPDWMRTVNAPGPDYAPIAMQTFTTDVVVATKLYKPKVLTAETPLDGSATLDIVYL